MNIQILLESVSAINKNYAKIAKITGENFNVFKILKVDTREVRLHSAFIAELLNPNGSHEQGNVFVIEFIKILKLKSNTDTPKHEITFQPEFAKIPEVEKWLGYTTETEGGYIDILLTDRTNKHIIIENKIYAGDQKNQLVRYHEYDREATIVYLTLDGRQPSEYSTQNKKEVLDKLICISYKDDILKWLEISKRYTIDHSLLRETLTQYINIIKYLTHQTMNEEMKNEIVENILRNEENYLSAQQIQSNFESAKLKLRENIKDEVVRLGKVEFSQLKFDYDGITIRFELEYENEDDEGFYYGFVAKDMNGDSRNLDLKKTLLPIILKIGNCLNLKENSENNGNFIGWIISSKSFRYRDTFDELYSKLTNQNYRKVYFNEIIEEGRNLWEEFKKQVENLKVDTL